ncbi:hypothetical protein B0T21DRAFT_93147 [Apiosordaria backusii]|uniref:C2H2-type domain-containing protein n=1 Tax=Apiosordaria backusii TaxID=314023 RepID=A0AA40EST1_9PEZI|nr:hypothetical protein B0T21DRAFT_93147 [Apiosordaria backusii]
MECPEVGCGQPFQRQPDLVRHRFTHIAWNRPCANCSDNFTTASAFIQHKCGRRSPKREQIDYRRKLVENELGLSITSTTRRRRGGRIKAKPPTDSSHATSFQQLGQDAMVHGESSSANPQTVEAMPSSALVGPAQPSSSTNFDMGREYTTTLWEQYTTVDWAQMPDAVWTTQS